MMLAARLTALFLGAVLALSAFAATAQSGAVDMARFDGRWFEIARSPNDVQKDCRRAQIDLTPQARVGRYGLLVTCTRRADGQVETLRANARVTDPGTNRRLRFSLTGILSFGGLAGQNYTIREHAADYSWAILSLPDGSDWWIWHRSQSPAAATRAELIRRAGALGLDTSEVVHTGR